MVGFISDRTTHGVTLKNEKVWTKLHEKYQSVDVLGQGTYGIVYKAVVLQDGKNPEEEGNEHLKRDYVALKRTALDSSMTHGIPDTALREIAILHDMKHPNILNTLEFSCNQSRIYVVMELLDKDLKQYIRGLQQAKKKMPVVDVKSIIFKTLHGLSYLHCHRVLHRDLKPHNILVSNDLKDIKLADFGLARSAHCDSKTLTHEVITLWYRPPELLLGDCVYDKKVDIWSVGCIMAELLMDGPLFDGESELDTLLKIFNKVGTPLAHEWPPNAMQLRNCFPEFPAASLGSFEEIYSRFPAMQDAKMAEDLILKMLKVNPNERIDALECINHPWFDSIRCLPEYAMYAKYHDPRALMETRNPTPDGTQKKNVLPSKNPSSSSDSSRTKNSRKNKEGESELPLDQLVRVNGVVWQSTVTPVLRSYSNSVDSEDTDLTQSTSFSISQSELQDRIICRVAGVDMDGIISKMYQADPPISATPVPMLTHDRTQLHGSLMDDARLLVTPNVINTPRLSALLDKRGDRIDDHSATSHVIRMEESLKCHIHTPRMEDRSMEHRPCSHGDPGVESDNGFSFLSSRGGVVANLTRRLSKEFENVGTAISRVLHWQDVSNVAPYSSRK